jgi:hypothetical protein
MVKILVERQKFNMHAKCFPLVLEIHLLVANAGRDM